MIVNSVVYSVVNSLVNSIVKQYNKGMTQIKSFEDLEVWQLAIGLAVKVYKLTLLFPKSETYGLIDQLKRAVTSISANIAEGFGRYYYKDSVKFLYNARGSLFEVKSHLLIARQLNLIPTNKESEYNLTLKDIQNLGVKLNNFISAIIRKSKNNLATE